MSVSRGGGTLVPRAADVWAKAEMVVKVKEPIEPEWPWMRKGQVVFTYFHFARRSRSTRAVITLASRHAYETVATLPRGPPAAHPMSEVAGRMAVQEGPSTWRRCYGGSGILLGGVPGVLPAEVLNHRRGVVGRQRAKMAAGLGARVTLLDLSLDRLRYSPNVLPSNVDLLYSNRYNLLEQLRRADLVIGAVLLPGAKAPKLVRRDDLKLMRPGSVIVDVAVDQVVHRDDQADDARKSRVRRDGNRSLWRGQHAGGVRARRRSRSPTRPSPYAKAPGPGRLEAGLPGGPRRCSSGLNVVEGKVVYPRRGDVRSPSADPKTSC